MKNIILIGMMGCGKTAVGSLLAQRLGRGLIDTDALIEARAGKTISDIFSDNGEAYFRELELALAQELGRTRSKIIACGGGLPLRDAAIAALKENGVVFWLDRDPGETYDSLDRSGRPLAQAGRADFLARYEARSPVYRRWADYIIAEKSPEAAAETVARLYILHHGPMQHRPEEESGV